MQKVGGQPSRAACRAGGEGGGLKNTRERGDGGGKGGKLNLS